MAAFDQETRQLVMAGPSGFVQGGKGLVNQQDMHAVILHYLQG